MDSFFRDARRHEGFTPPSFEPDPMGGWSCPWCNMKPYHLRAPGSFSRDKPSMEHVEQHFAVCLEGEGKVYQSTGYQHAASTTGPPRTYASPAPFQGAAHHAPPEWYGFPTSTQQSLHSTSSGHLTQSEHGWPSSEAHASFQPPRRHPQLGERRPTVSRPLTGPSEGSSRDTLTGHYYPSLPTRASPSQTIPSAPSQHTYYSRPQQPQETILEGMVSSASRDAGSRHAAAHFLAAESTRLNFETGANAVVLPEDKPLLTDYFYFLNQQLMFCRFTDEDRRSRGGKRESIEVGFGGIQCRHCANESGSRKFFWSNVDRVANSFVGIANHVLKCWSCPREIKDALTDLKLNHRQQMAELPRGTQKVFFRRMWRRMQSYSTLRTGGDDVTAGTGSTLSTSSDLDGANKNPSRTQDTRAGSSDTSLSPTSRNPCSTRLLLAIPEDSQWLSDLDCFVRRSLEVFPASETDVIANRLGRRYPISIGQIGIRCIYCASSTQGASGTAVSYPHYIGSLYKAVREIKRVHLETCPNLPSDEKEQLSRLTTSTSLPSVLRRYYVLAAKSLGMCDTSSGIRSERGSVPLGAKAPLDITLLTLVDPQESSEGHKETARHELDSEEEKYRVQSPPQGRFARQESTEKKESPAASTETFLNISPQEVLFSAEANRKREAISPSEEAEKGPVSKKINFGARKRDS